MSLDSWKAQYYKVGASRACSSARAAIEHSVRKWEGLRESALEAHGLKWRGCVITDYQDSFYVSNNTCALCVRYLNDEVDDAHECLTCPLYILRGCKCFALRENETVDPYTAFTLKADPEPMIRWLKLAQEKADDFD